MFKKLACAALLAAALPCVAMAAKPVNSEKMVNDYDRFYVVYVDDDERIYADNDTIARDPVSAGMLPVIRCTLYAEVYKDPLTYPDYGNKQMVDHILQLDCAVGADQIGQDIRYKILNKVVGAYTPDGKPLPAYNGNHKDTADEAEEIYMSLYRVSSNFGW